MPTINDKRSDKATPWAYVVGVVWVAGVFCSAILQAGLAQVL